MLAAALQYGYSSADAFARAFARQHGVTPSQARDPACPLQVWPPVSFSIAVTGAEAAAWRLLETPAIPLRGLRWPLAAAAGERFDAVGELWLDMRNMQRIHPKTEGVWYGIWENGVYYMARPAAEAIPDGTQPFAIAAGTYAVFSSGGGGNAAEIIRLRRLAFEYVLPEAGYRQSRDYEVEVLHAYETPQKSRRRYELWIPVEKCHVGR